MKFNERSEVNEWYLALKDDAIEGWSIKFILETYYMLTTPCGTEVNSESLFRLKYYYDGYLKGTENV